MWTGSSRARDVQPSPSSYWQTPRHTTPRRTAHAAEPRKNSRTETNRAATKFQGGANTAVQDANSWHTDSGPSQHRSWSADSDYPRRSSGGKQVQDAGMSKRWLPFQNKHLPNKDAEHHWGRDRWDAGWSNSWKASAGDTWQTSDNWATGWQDGWIDPGSDPSIPRNDRMPNSSQLNKDPKQISNIDRTSGQQIVVETRGRNAGNTAVSESTSSTTAVRRDHVGVVSNAMWRSFSEGTERLEAPLQAGAKISQNMNPQENVAEKLVNFLLAKPEQFDRREQLMRKLSGTGKSVIEGVVLELHEVEAAVQAARERLTRFSTASTTDTAPSGSGPVHGSCASSVQCNDEGTVDETDTASEISSEDLSHSVPPSRSKPAKDETPISSTAVASDIECNAASSVTGQPVPLEGAPSVETKVATSPCGSLAKGKEKGSSTLTPSSTPKVQIQKGVPPPRKGGPGAKGNSPPVGKGGLAAKACEPRKPDILPSTQVKKLYWNSFRLGNTEEDTIWNAIDKDSLSIDTGELDTLFADEPRFQPVSNELSSSTGETSRRAARKIQILDNQRRQQVCVMLARLPEKQEVSDAVLTMDHMKLDKDQVELLFLNVPSEEESTLLRNAETEHTIDDSHVWDTAEDFLFSLIRIPQYKLRLQIWDFKNTFQERFDALSKSERDLSNACTLLLTSNSIRHVLGIALFVGNYLNGGTSRGRADGFAIDTLTQMRTVKMSQGEGTGTLVDYIFHQMEKTYPGELNEIFSTGNAADRIKCAARYKLGDLTKEATRFKTIADQLLTEVGSSECAVDPTFAHHGKILSMRIAELNELVKRFQKLEEQYSKLGVWFHMDDAKEKRSSDEFFGIWNKFLLDIRQASSRAQEASKHDLLRRSLTPKTVTIASGTKELESVPTRSFIAPQRGKVINSFGELSRAFSQAPPSETLLGWRA